MMMDAVPVRRGVGEAAASARRCFVPVSAFLLCFLVTSSIFPAARAYPAYLAQIPNGRAIPHPTVEGSTCNAVGHDGCTAGAPRIPFGLDFAAAGYTWTKALCDLDSDGDGFTNGEEMGDPCCAWSSSAASAPLFAEASQLSHPGFSSSVPSFAQRDALAAVDCNAGAPADNGGALEDMFYNPGETRLSERYQFHTDIPAKETTYMQYTFNLPAEPSVRNVVGFQSIIENHNHMHHYVVTGCSKPFPERYDGVMTEQCITRECPEGYEEIQFAYGCTDIFYLWAPGIDEFAFPNQTTYPIGPGVGIYAVHVQIHYDNHNLLANQTDDSALIFHMIPEKRQYTAGFLSLGPQLLYFQEIPAGESSYYFSARCRMEVNMDLAPEGVIAEQFLPHMHLRGRRMWTEVLGQSDGIEMLPTTFAKVSSEPLHVYGSIDDFDSSLNLAYEVTPEAKARRIRRGDLLTTTCIYNTTGSDKPVRGGFGTHDEMCITFMLFYPADAVPAKTCLDDSKDPIFSGTWPSNLSQTKSSILELPEVAAKLMAPDETTYGKFAYPTNDLSVLQPEAGTPTEDTPTTVEEVKSSSFALPRASPSRFVMAGIAALIAVLLAAL